MKRDNLNRSCNLLIFFSTNLKTTFEVQSFINDYTLQVIAELFNSTLYTIFLYMKKHTTFQLK